MAYIPLRIQSRQSNLKATVSLMAEKGENNRDLPQLLNLEYAQIIENFIVDSEGGLAKSRGFQQVANISGQSGVQILGKKQYFNNVVIIAYSTTVSALDLDTGTETVIKSDFANDDPFDGDRVGGYFFVNNGSGDLQRISVTLAYDAQTANFTIGTILTQQNNSGFRAVILEDSDAGTTGTLTLRILSGLPVDNEIIEDGSGGSATANGTIAYSIAAPTTNAPRGQVIEYIGNRLYVGQDDRVFYSDSNAAATPPFDNWTVGTDADSPNTIEFRGRGNVASIAPLGQQVVVFYDGGKAGARIEIITGTAGQVQVLREDFYRTDFGGFRGAITTPVGLFYDNEAGIWLMTTGVETNIPFSDRETQISLILGKDQVDSLDFSDSDLLYDLDQNSLLVTVRENASVNNLMLIYNTDRKAWSRRTNWNIRRLASVSQGRVYGSSSLDGFVYQLFEGNDDNGQEIFCRYRQEISSQIGSPYTLKDLEEFRIQGELGAGQTCTIRFDVHDRFGKLVESRRTVSWIGDAGAIGADTYGSAVYSSSNYGGSLSSAVTAENYQGARQKVYMRNFQRLIVDIQETSSFPFVINWMSAFTTDKPLDERRGLA